MAKAADQIVEKGARLAAWRLESAVADLEFSAGQFRVRGTDRAIGLFEVAAAGGRSDAPEGLRGPLDGASDETVSTPSFPYGCAVCEVEVDPETGLVEVVRYTSVDDVGRAINPLIVDGQTHGGIVQGLGQALWEHCRYDAESGQLQSARPSWSTRCRAPICCPRSPPRSARYPPPRTRSACGAAARAARLRPSGPR